MQVKLDKEISQLPLVYRQVNMFRLLRQLLFVIRQVLQDKIDLELLTRM